MKVLFIAPFAENSGWSVACTNYILALDAVGVDVAIRRIKLNDIQPELPKRIQELESKSSKGCDIVIQYILPHFADFNGHFDKNIIQYVWETSSFKMSAWPTKINTMDEAWVCNRSLIDISKQSGVNIPVKVVPHTFDMKKYEREYPAVEIPQSKDSFLFYFIGEMNNRKNLEALIKAFHLEFSRNEPVNLVIKSTAGHKQIADFCNKVKNKLKLYPNLQHYKPEIIISDFLSEEQLCRLHTTCDCFVMPSFGEAWCIPAFEAMAFGNAVVANSVGGIKEYLSEETGWPVKNRLEPVYDLQVPWNDLGQARESYWSIDVYDLMRCMRSAYDNPTLREKLTKTGKKQVQEFSYEVIGNQIKDLLNA